MDPLRLSPFDTFEERRRKMEEFRATQAEGEPLTDEELAELVWDAGMEPSGRRLDTVTFGDRVMGLVAEVRRLRALNQALDDIGSLLEALGKPNVARPDSPQAVMRECIEEVRRLREATRQLEVTKHGDARRQLLCNACHQIHDGGPVADGPYRE